MKTFELWKKKLAKKQERKKNVVKNPPNKKYSLDEMRTPVPMPKLDSNINDEFMDYFQKGIQPKIAITISTFQRMSKKVYKFVENLVNVFPNSKLLHKRTMPFKKFINLCIAQDYTDIVMVGVDNNIPNRIIICHLCNGGVTACFKLTSLKLTKQINHHGNSTDHKPELILNHFTTELGFRVGTLLSALFPQVPQFSGRQAVTFHNQRDFIFFRFHRYIFQDNSNKPVGLQELGPRFTLKLKWIQKGMFNTKSGDYEFYFKNKDVKHDRRKFLL